MKIQAGILTAALALAVAAPQAAGRKENNEARLAKMLEGRTAGAPVDCIRSFKGNQLEVIEDVALVYDDGNVIYVARPTNPESIGPSDVIVINRFGGQLCHSDVVRTVDRQGGYTTGVVFLEKFVPYRKAD